MGTVLVTGAGGDLGGSLVRRLLTHDHTVIALIREGAVADLPAGVEVIGADVRKRADVDPLVSRADTVVHLATDTVRRSVDVDGTANVAYACTESEKHLVYVSVVGANKSRFPYYRTKARVERNLKNVPGLAYTVQRATQFHGTIDRLLALPVIPLPGEGLFQPVDPNDLAGRLVGLVAAGPSGEVQDYSGPTVVSVDDMVQIRQEVKGKAGRQLQLPRFSVLAEAVDGVFISDETDTGLTTYREWLTSDGGSGSRG